MSKCRIAVVFIGLVVVVFSAGAQAGGAAWGMDEGELRSVFGEPTRVREEGVSGGVVRSFEYRMRFLGEQATVRSDVGAEGMYAMTVRWLREDFSDTKLGAFDKYAEDIEEGLRSNYGDGDGATGMFTSIVKVSNSWETDESLIQIFGAAGLIELTYESLVTEKVPFEAEEAKERDVKGLSDQL